MPGGPDDGVVRRPRDAYGDTFAADLLEQYKLYVHSAENVSARRIASNRLFLALNVGLVVLYGIQPAVSVRVGGWFRLRFWASSSVCSGIGLSGRTGI